MNRIRIILVVAVLGLLRGIVLPVVAQSDPKAAMEAINYVIRHVRPSTGAEPLAEELCKRFKKHPEVTVAIGEAFYQAGDSLTAKKYFRRAIQEHPDYAPVYIAAGAWAEERYNAYDEAMEWYDQAIKANPKDSTGYIRYAKVLTKLRRPAEAADKIKEITQYVPEFPVNKEIARIYANLGQLSEAIDFYAKENLDNLDSEDLKDYATDLFLKHQYKESLEVAKFGVGKFPKLAPLSRLCLYNSVELKEFKDAVKHGDYLFTKTEKHNNTWQDLYYMALACKGANEPSRALTWFEQCTKAKDISERERNESYRSIARIYKDMGEYDQASEAYDRLYQLQKAENNVSAQDINMHARLFLEQSTEVNGEEVYECYRKANRLYELLAQESPDNAPLAYHAIMQNFQRMDPNFEQKLAIEPANRLINLLKGKSDLSDTEKRLLADGYWTLCYNQAITRPLYRGIVKKWGEEILKLNPADERPKRIFVTLKIQYP